MKKKFLVIPGEIRSKFDGQLHYISAEQLIRLYNVDPSECTVIGNRMNFYGIDRSKYIELRPRYDGYYSLNDLLKEQKNKIFTPIDIAKARLKKKALCTYKHIEKADVSTKCKVAKELSKALSTDRFDVYTYVLAAGLPLNVLFSAAILSFSKNLEQLENILNQTKGKARKKIRRQLRNLKRKHHA